MKKISKAALAEVDVALDEVTDAAAKVTELRDTIANAIAEHWSAYTEAVTEYNSSVERLNDEISAIVDDIAEFIEGKSDKWRDGEVGSSYEEWRNAIEACKVDEVSEGNMPELDDLDLLNRDDFELPELS